MAWTIKAYVFPIQVLGLTVAGHLYLDIYDSSGNRIHQFNGLATDRDTNTPKATGSQYDQLKAWFHNYGFLAGSGTNESTNTHFGAEIFSGTQAQIEKAIDHLEVYRDYINNLDISYNLLADTGYNSNSVFAGAIDVLDNLYTLNTANLSSVVDEEFVLGYDESPFGSNDRNFDIFTILEDGSGNITGIKVEDIGAPKTNSLLSNNMIGLDTDDELYGLTKDDTMHAKGGNDKLFGGEGNDHAYGEGGNDTFIGDIGSDYLYGGEGYDIADYSNTDAYIKILKVEGAEEGTYTVDKYYGQTSATGSYERDYLFSIEEIKGTPANGAATNGAGGKVINGNEESNSLAIPSGDDYAISLYGKEEDDLLYGWNHDDYLDGGEGDDYISGNDGLYGGLAFMFVGKSQPMSAYVCR